LNHPVKLFEERSAQTHAETRKLILGPGRSYRVWYNTVDPPLESASPATVPNHGSRSFAEPNVPCIREQLFVRSAGYTKAEIIQMVSNGKKTAPEGRVFLGASLNGVSASCSEK